MKLENLTENMNELLESSTSTTLLLTLDSIKRDPSIIETQAQPSRWFVELKVVKS